MKKLLMVVLLLGLANSYAAAQEMEEGTNLLSLGIGGVPGIGANLSYDYGLVEGWGPGIFTIGAFAGGDSQTETYKNGGITYTHMKWFFAPRITYRYTIAPKWEVYGAAMLGIALERFDYNNHFLPVEDYRRPDENHLDFGLAAGGRYCISDKFSVFTEIGYNVSYLNLGISFEF